MAVFIIFGGDCGLSNLRVLAQDRFNFPQLDPIAPDFDLLIRTPKKFNVPIRTILPKVSRSI